MKLTEKTVKWFESEQKQWGTKTALFNFLYLFFYDMVKDTIGRDRRVTLSVTRPRK